MTYSWNSPLVIVLLTLGGLLFILFVVYEAKYARIPIMPSTSRKRTFANGSAPLHDPFSCIDIVPNFFRGDSLLWQSVLPSYILSSPSTAKYYYIGCTTSASHHHTNSNCHTGGSDSRKVFGNLNLLTLEPDDIIPVSGQVLHYGPLD